MHPRADDGIRTRDPHLGKVMRYQLRYIRAQRTRSSPGAKHDDSPPEWARTNFLVPSGAPLSAAQQRVLPTHPRVLTFDVIRLLAPVPWLSGRASASHAEGRWFDPSRDHICCRRQDMVSSPAKQDRCYLGVIRLSGSPLDGTGSTELNFARHARARPKSSRHVDELLDERLTPHGRAGRPRGCRQAQSE